MTSASAEDVHRLVEKSVLVVKENHLSTLLYHGDLPKLE